jgi:hypothetical protein
MVLRGRLKAESLMLDSCTIGRQSGVFTDPDTGQVVPTFTTVYDGKCKVQATATQAANPTAGGHQFTVQDTRLDLPVSAGPVAVDDTVTLNSAVLDSQLAGRVYRIVEVFHKSMATAQRTRVSEVVA